MGRRTTALHEPGRHLGCHTGRRSGRGLVRRGSGPAASADGQVILFWRDEPGDQGGTWKANAEGRDAVRLSIEASSAVVAPDGRTALILSSRGGPQSLWLSSLDGRTPAHIVQEFVPGQAFDISPDGTMLFYIAPARSVRYQDRSLATAVTCRLPDCSEPRTVTMPPRRGGRVRWTPDGRGPCSSSPAASI